MMFKSLLKLIFTLVCINGFVFMANAQQVHFVYLQTETNQPFYVKVNSKVVSSSPAGYVIIPNLADSAYEMVIGFPKNEFPEEKFTVTVDKKNEGFLIKNFGEKGWSLFNMQTLALIEKTEAPATVAVVTKIQDDPFSKMLASVVKDSSILRKIVPVAEKPAVAVAEKAPDTVAERIPDTVAEKIPDVVAEKPVVTIVEASSDSVNKAIEKAVSTDVATPTVATSSVSKIMSLKEKDGLEMIYLDKGEKERDTIRIFMPILPVANVIAGKVNEYHAPAAEDKIIYTPSAVDTSQLTITPTVITAPPASVARDLHFEKRETAERPAIIIYDSSSTGNKSPEIPKAADKEKGEILVLPRAVTSSKVNSDCKAFATDADFLKLRKRMAGESSNDDMIDVAKKVFKSICFSTEQIKNLSYLFLNDEGKYMFFDAAYAYTSDSDLYINLESQLTDPYYVTRFKAMIHK